MIGATVLAAWYVGSVLIILLASEERVLIDEAKAVAPRIVSVKRTLSPGTFNEIARARAVNIFSRQALQLLRSLVNCLDVGHGKVNVIGQWLRLEIGAAFAGHVDESQNHRATIDVVARAARDAAAAIVEQFAVKLFGAIEIVDLQNDPVQCGRHSGVLSHRF